jgi:hypothetical protein
MQVILAAVFYSLVTIAAGMAVPWTSLIGKPLPVAEAFRVAFGSDLAAKLVLFTGLLGLLTTWNAVLLAGSRVLFALGRARMISGRFGTVDPVTGAPTFALMFAGVVSVVGLALGRRALLPLLTVTAISQAAAFVLVSIGVVKLRRTHPELRRPYRVPGGVPVALHTPTEVKAAVTGSGRADKAQVTSMVTRICRMPGPPKPADAADAIAIAICQIWRGEGQRQLSAAVANQASSEKLAHPLLLRVLHPPLKIGLDGVAKLLLGIELAELLDKRGGQLRQFQLLDFQHFKVVLAFQVDLDIFWIDVDVFGQNRDQIALQVG